MCLCKESHWKIPENSWKNFSIVQSVFPIYLKHAWEPSVAYLNLFISGRLGKAVIKSQEESCLWVNLSKILYNGKAVYWSISFAFRCFSCLRIVVVSAGLRFWDNSTSFKHLLIRVRSVLAHVSQIQINVCTGILFCVSASFRLRLAISLLVSGKEASWSENFYLFNNLSIIPRTLRWSRVY